VDNNIENSNHSKNIKIALAGNPNVGKSIVFNYLTGQYVEVSNFPGTTVEVYNGKYKNYEVYDTPGIYSLASFNDEEKVAKEFILDSDIVINIVDANHLERDLFLTLQLIDMGKRVIILMNIIDELEKNNIQINFYKLSKILGVPIIPAIAPKGTGLDKLSHSIDSASCGNQNKIISKKLNSLKNSNIPLAEAVLLLENDESIKQKYGLSDEYNRDEIYFGRRIRVNEIVSEVLRNTGGKSNLGLLLGRFFIHPVTGVFSALFILYLVYLFIGKFIAGDVVEFTEKKLGHEYYEYNIRKYFASNSYVTIMLEPKADQQYTQKQIYTFTNGIDNENDRYNSLIKDVGKVQIKFEYKNPFLTILFGEFGILTMTVSYLLFLLLPLVLGFYFMLAILEDTGYLPRLATLVDRLLTYIGLNGKAIIPIILGFGCVTMATMTTRILGSKRERTIATTILQLAIPCSAQLGVIATLLAKLELKITLIYVLIIFTFMVMVGTILSRLIPGDTTPLLIDLPGIRLPRLRNILKKTIYRSYGFMKEASPWFLFGALLISIMQLTGILKGIIDFMHPLVVHWLKLPAEAGIAFVMGLVRRDFGAAGLYDLNLSPFQVLVALITLTLFVPCVTSLIIMFKERGLKEGGLIWFASLSLAFIIGGLTAQIIL
jgi:ferrous iron transport protein B